MMNRKKKKELRQRQSTRQLMGIVKITPHGIQTEAGERVFYLIRPDNLSVLSPEVIRSRIRSLTVLLSTQPALEILALDSRESFQRNKKYGNCWKRTWHIWTLSSSPPPPPANSCWRSHCMRKRMRVKGLCGSWKSPSATMASRCALPMSRTSSVFWQSTTSRT